MSKTTVLLTVGEDDASSRVDRFLADQFPALSRAKWIELIEGGEVKVNGKVTKASAKLSLGAQVECPADLSDSLPQAFKIECARFDGLAPQVLFEDEDLMVLSKAPTLGVHPGAGLSLENTLLGWAIFTGRITAKQNWPQELLDEERPGVVHRLDKATSGLLVMAKNPEAHAGLAEQFREHTAQRHYWAVVNAPLSFLEGDILKGPVRKAAGMAGSKFALKRHEDETFTLVCFMERDPGDKTRYRVSPKGEGRKSVSHFARASQNANYALLELKLDTGRTHQIRVHTQFLGHPLVGDDAYGGEKFRRLLLHAYKLNFKHPRSGKPLSFQSAWPTEDLHWLSEQGLSLQEHDWDL